MLIPLNKVREVLKEQSLTKICTPKENIYRVSGLIKCHGNYGAWSTGDYESLKNAKDEAKKLAKIRQNSTEYSDRLYIILNGQGKCLGVF